MTGRPGTDVRVAVALPSLLGESPMWHPREQVLYYCDIPGRKLHRFDPASGDVGHWDFDTEVACVAPMLGGQLMLGMRDGIWRFNPKTGARTRLAKPPYDPTQERFNDGKCDPQGRVWVGTIYEPRDKPLASLHCLCAGRLIRKAEGITVGNGLAWSPNGRTMYWSDTKAHTIYAFDFEPHSGEISGRRVFASFPGKDAGASLDGYGGRPDGAAVDVEGRCWVAMFEGQRLLCLSPEGQVVRDVELPVRCATMPCFGGSDLKTLYVTTARENRPATELMMQPLAGCVLALEVDVPGLPVNFVS
jgi:sugar lactone lactonase YvrE